jgi:conserved hypothetical protein, cofD-related
MGKGPREMDLPRIVVIGGGTGLSVMLRGLKALPLDITAIVTVADDGGSSGVLRSEMQMPPPGDIRNVLLALADVEPMLSKVLQHRFHEGSSLAGHSLGNLILAAMKEITGDFVTAVKELSKVLAVRGQVLPASAQPIELIAEYSDGSQVRGESQIPKRGMPIRKVRIEPVNAVPLAEAVEAIERADAIIIGPGSLYTSIIPNLIVPGIATAIVRSRAVKIFVCNVMTQPGETDRYSAGMHVNAIVRHVPDITFDYIVVNDGPISQEVLKKYAEQGAEPVRLDRKELDATGAEIIADRLVLYRTYLRHDTERLSEHILRIVHSWTAKKR